MATQIEIQSKIKTIYVELPEYQFQHGVPSDYKYFIGREKVRDRLRNILLNAKDGSGGVYLVAGYRGMGKTSLVNKVIEDVKKEGKTYHPILISLSQDDIREFDVLKFFATQFYLVWSQINFNKTSEQCKKEVSYISLRLGWLFDHLNAIVKTHTHIKSKYGFEQEHKGKEIIRKESVPKEIEKELIYLLQLYEDIREKSGFPRLIFIIDELDKIEPSYLYNIDYNHNDLPSQSELDNIFGINKVRRRQEVITRILANLKSFLNTAKAKFVFIGGREMYDAALADIADRDSFYSSIFHDVMYVNSFLKDQLTETRSGITRLTEAFLCKILLPVNYVKSYRKESISSDDLSGRKDDQIYNLTTYYHYLIDIFRCKGDEFNPHYSKTNIKNIDNADDKNAIYKLVFFFKIRYFFLLVEAMALPKNWLPLLSLIW